MVPIVFGKFVSFFEKSFEKIISCHKFCVLNKIPQMTK